MKHKVAELEGDDLDVAVALALGWEHWISDDGSDASWHAPVSGDTFRSRADPWSRMWEFGGPIIERERIDLEIQDETDGPNEWSASTAHGECYGPTPLIAAMRAFVASKFGDEVDLP
jgi:hypothetical protein